MALFGYQLKPTVQMFWRPPRTPPTGVRNPANPALSLRSRTLYRAASSQAPMPELSNESGSAGVGRPKAALSAFEGLASPVSTQLACAYQPLNDGSGRMLLRRAM